MGEPARFHLLYIAKTHVKFRGTLSNMLHPKRMNDLEQTLKSGQDLFLCAGFPFESEKRKVLSSCIYHGNIFFGVYDKENDKISFSLEDGSKVRPDIFQTMVQRAINFISLNIKKESGIEKAWLRVLPLLDAYILYKSYTKQSCSGDFTNGKFEAGVNALVEAYESSYDSAPTMEGLYLAVNGKVPSLDMAWELHAQQEKQEEPEEKDAGDCEERE